MTRWAALIAALLAASPAGAQCLGFQCPPGVLGAGASGAGSPLDGFTQPAAAYSFRKLRGAYAGSAVRLFRVSDSAQLDIGFTAAGDFNTAAAAAHCAATTCQVYSWYDQSGNGRDAVHDGNPPTLVFNCLGSTPCLQTSTSGQRLLVGPFAGFVAKTSVNTVGKRVSGLASCYFIQKGLNVIGSDTTANTWAASDFTSNTYTMPAADNAWHAGQAVTPTGGVPAVGRIDAAETVGPALTGAAGGHVILMTATTGTVCQTVEGIAWDDYALTAGERTALADNQKNYWTPLPLDTFATPAAAYSLRKLKSTYSGPAIRIRRASDNLETDINFLGFTSFTGAPLDTAAANAHCAATTCAVTVWYDQSGFGRNLLQATPASQPPLKFNCQGSLPCMETTSAGSETLNLSGISSATGVVSLSAVAQRVSGAGACSFRQNGLNNRLDASSVAANSWRLSPPTGAIVATAADGVWHTVLGVINGASSLLRIDSTETAGTATGATASGVMTVSGGAATVCRIAEFVIWDNYVTPLVERTALQTNQKSFWSTP